MSDLSGSSRNAQPQAIVVDRAFRSGADHGMEIHLDAAKGFGRHVETSGRIEHVDEVRVLPFAGDVDRSPPLGVAQAAPGATLDQVEPGLRRGPIHRLGACRSVPDLLDHGLIFAQGRSVNLAKLPLKKTKVLLISAVR
ncbi:hypothetical protein [Dactylosporangium sp. CS-033363]|uniref:hypothetical protein n=1 Tax=Dactylosporangium sp. CS-033363 TaxID=3239935 RepID=UPI003D93108E